ncbi:MAG: isocitrate lyase/PEP mutase family protein [Thermoplasmata archaeon]
MAVQIDKAETFRKLHRQDRPLVLPNAWDVPSARLFEEAGFPAVATSSAGLLVSLGYVDGEEIPRREMVAAVARIASRLSVPLSADIVAGFGRSPRGLAATVRLIVEAGAVGVNLEDYDPAQERLYPLGVQLRRLQTVREVGRSMDVPLVVNARTDALSKGKGTPEELREEALHRCAAYRDAGADCVYPMRLTDAASISSFVQGLHCPVNVMVRKGLPPISDLTTLGVKRVSFGPGASYAAMGLLKRISEEVLTHGTYASMLDGAIAFDELNRLAIPRTAPTP